MSWSSSRFHVRAQTLHLIEPVTRHLTQDGQTANFSALRIRNVVHKGLRNLTDRDDRSGVPAVAADKILRIVSFLQDMQHEDELRAIPSWKAHMLSGNRKDEWSFSVTKNWRITFCIDRQTIEIVDLNFEDYH